MEKEKKYVVTALCCAHCGCKLKSDVIKFSDGTEYNVPDLACPGCGKFAIKFVPRDKK